MNIEQFVMAYGVEHDRLRAILPKGFVSLRPVLRINLEIRDQRFCYLEFNTAVEHDGARGWLNIGNWSDLPFIRSETGVRVDAGFIDISFRRVGIEGGCPAEKDNAGCYFLGRSPELRLPEIITANREFCDCRFAWHFDESGVHGVSIGKTLPAVPTESKVVYPQQEFTVKNAAAIPCEQVLGAYAVLFERE